MRTRRYVGGAAAAVLICAAAPQAEAAPAPSALVLTGARSASVDVTFSAPTTFDLARMAVRGDGRFAGFYAEAVDRPVRRRAASGAHLGALSIRDLHAPGQPGLTLGFDSSASETLQAGRYRVYLIAERPATLTIPLRGSAGMTLRPTRVARTAFAQDADILKSLFQAENAQSLVVAGSRSVSLTSILVGRFRAYVGEIGSCIRVPEAECGSTTQGGDGPYTGYVLSPLSELDMSFTVTYAPGALPPRRYEAYQAALNATTLQYASGAALSLALD